MSLPPLTGRLVIYDTEFTAWEGSWQRGWSGMGEHRELIQIGAVVLDGDNGFTELDSFDILLKPIWNPQLSDYIISLTGITQSMVDAHGTTVFKALSKFAKFCGDMPAYSYGNDADILRENCDLNHLSHPAHPGGFADIRPYLDAVGVETSQYSSGTVHRAVGATMNGHVHNALFDVRSIATTLRILRERGQL
jgi:inhibitor of KinA sporulation pathway (predicted exonuclease)